MNQHSFLHPFLQAVRKAFFLAVTLVVGSLGWPTLSVAATTKYVEGSVIVTFKPATALNEAKAVLANKSLAFARHYSLLSTKRNRHTGLVKHPTKTTAQLIADLKNDPSVESVEPDYIRWVNGQPNDPNFANLWAMHNTGQAVNGTTGTAGDDVKFIEAWNQARSTTDNVVVGVVDTGVDFGHPDLAANMWVNTAETTGNGVDDDANGYVDDVYGYDFVNALSHPDDSGYHGTHVAGTIAAVGNNQEGVIGVNYHAKIMALKVSSDGQTLNSSAIIAAFQYATLMKGRGVNIVALNGSYGGGGSSTAEVAAIQAAGDAGIVFCVAAGNDTANNDTTPSYPASYRLANMIVVAASDQNDGLASFSNYGATTVDIAAPGTNVYSTKPSTLSVQVGATTYASTPFTYSGVTAGFTGTVYDCGIGNPGDFPTAVRGNIALIARGTLYFSQKVTNAMAAGATAAIIYNNTTGLINGTLQQMGEWIPALALTQADGLAIKAALPTSATLVANGLYQYLDGTSMATPHVTGAVAFAALNFPGDSVAQRIHRVLASAEAKTGLQGKVATNGRLNLLRIVDANSDGVPDWLESDQNAPVVTTATQLPGAVVGSAYSQPLVASGGTAPYAWSVYNGTLPDGLSLTSDGILSGTPTTAGGNSFSVLVTDNVAATNGKLFTLTVASTPLSISTSAQLADGMVNASYQGTLVAAGGTSPYTWAMTAGALPAGVSLSSSGSLTGTPTAYGTFQFTAQVTDAGASTQSQAFTLIVDPLPMVITSHSPLPTGAINLAYAQSLTMTGGAGPFTWTVSSGTLPPGLGLDVSGSITGTPTAAGTFTFVPQVEDSGARTTTQTFSLTIEPLPLTITTSSQLNPGVKGVPYLAQTLSVSGGTAPYVWTISTGALPPGLHLNSAGLLSGTPTTAGVFSFTATTTDSFQLALSAAFQVTVTSSYVKPVVNQPVLGTTTIGVPFSYTVSATNYPKSFAISGLPAGLTYSTTTGVISGRPVVSGTFTATVKATNPSGTSLPVTAQLVVNALAKGLVGSFTGVVARDASVNSLLGSRLTLTTSSTGVYTAKITTGAVTTSITGYLAATVPQITASVGHHVLTLTLDGNTSLLSGTLDTASVSGWRQTWIAATRPATSRAGYYSIALNLAAIADPSTANFPQGSGYATFTVTTAGTLTVSGKTADGQALTSAGPIGPNGEIPVYAPLYSNLGSIVGTLTLATPSALLADNTASGTLTWLKPATAGRTYPAAFGPASINASGMYLAKAATGQIILGLPSAGLANVVFVDGGLAASLVNPNVTGFTYTAAYAIVLPAAGGPDNPGKATLAINRNTGLVTGTFTLVETSPLLTRKPAFQGMIVRSATGTTRAEGYFLLPQIPSTGQTILTSPILSGKMLIEQ